MTSPDSFFKAGSFSLPLGRKTYTVGILNVTPDSFSDGGQFFPVSEAIRQAETLVAAGADILDIGGESTRPGSQQVSAAEEISRIVPVIEHLAKTCQIPISVDIFKSSVADAALTAGATIVNDVTGLMGDPAMAAVAAAHQAGVILMHNAVLYRKDHPSARMFTNLPLLDDETRALFAGLDLLSSARLFLKMGISRARSAGIEWNRILLDPGIGFGLSTDESLLLLASLKDIRDAGLPPLPILVGPSRKRFIGELLDKPVDERLYGTLSVVVASIARGADFVRVHDVEPVTQAVRVSDAIFRR